MKLSLVPLSDKDAEKLKQALNTSPEFGKMLECIEAEAAFGRHNLCDTLIPSAVLKTDLTNDERLSALHVMQLDSALLVLNMFLESDTKLHTLDIEK